MIEVNIEVPERKPIESTVTINARPIITGVTATVDNNTGIPYVDVTETGTESEFSFNLAFHNLKGASGSGGSDNIFIAEYNVTSYDDIKAAYNSGKAVFCKDLVFACLYNITNSAATFFSLSYTANALIFKCTSSSEWSYETHLLEKSSNKVTSISASSTNTQYPSAKCVYDLIDSLQQQINALQQ